jgi:hypothetical protein
MLVPIVLGADKTTVSVATGQTEYHPVYISPGNVHNSMRRAHRDAVIPIAFLAIPKCACLSSRVLFTFTHAVFSADRQYSDTKEYRLFKRKLYHESLRQILEPLRGAMATPHLVLCPDGHWRTTIFSVGPFIADYPEQVELAGVVSTWCPKFDAYPINPIQMLILSQMFSSAD